MKLMQLHLLFLFFARCNFEITEYYSQICDECVHRFDDGQVAYRVCARAKYADPGRDIL